MHSSAKEIAMPEETAQATARKTMSKGAKIGLGIGIAK